MRGASTITQQLAKNLYLSPTRNPLRKLNELLITRRLEHELSKTRIFELYLNDIEWGDGIWGAEAAHARISGFLRPPWDPSSRADGRRHRQSTRAQHCEAERAAAGATADYPRANGQRHAAASHREACPGRDSCGIPVPNEDLPPLEPDSTDPHRPRSPHRSLNINRRWN